MSVDLCLAAVAFASSSSFSAFLFLSFFVALFLRFLPFFASPLLFVRAFPCFCLAPKPPAPFHVQEEG